MKLVRKKERAKKDPGIIPADSKKGYRLFDKHL